LLHRTGHPPVRSTKELRLALSWQTLLVVRVQPRRSPERGQLLGVWEFKTNSIAASVAAAFGHYLDPSDDLLTYLSAGADESGAAKRCGLPARVQSTPGLRLTIAVCSALRHAKRSIKVPVLRLRDLTNMRSNPSIHEQRSRLLSEKTCLLLP
jgi:hypothetical protein